MTTNKKSFRYGFLLVIALITLLLGHSLTGAEAAGKELYYSAAERGDSDFGRLKPVTTPPVLRVGTPGVVPNAQRGATVAVDLQLDSSGGEIATAFTLKYNPNILSLNAVVTGTQAAAKGFSLILNQDRIAFGELGMALFNFGSGRFDVSPPANNIVRITFNVNSAAAIGLTPIGFIGEGCPNNPGTAPTACSVAGVNSIGDPFAIFPTYTDGSVNISNAGNSLEGDINRPVGALNTPGVGDGVVDGLDVAQYNTLLLNQATLSSGFQGSEFQRMDTADVATFGNGCLQPADKQQIRNYSVGGPPTWVAAAGPTAQTCPARAEIAALAKTIADIPVIHDTDASATARKINVVSVQGQANTDVTVAVMIESQGNEANMAFSLDFDTTRLSFDGPGGVGPNAFAVIGPGAPGGAVTANTTGAADGHIAIGVDSNSNFSAGAKQVAKLIFKVKAGAPAGAGFIRFSDSLISRQVVLTDFTTTVPTYSDGAVNVTASGPDAGGISVSGRVFTAEGQGLRSASVTITDADGNRRSVITNSFGSYQIDNVAVGGTYVIGVTAKRYRFASRTIQLSDNLAGLDFTGQE